MDEKLKTIYNYFLDCPDRSRFDLQEFLDDRILVIRLHCNNCGFIYWMDEGQIIEDLGCPRCCKVGSIEEMKDSRS